MICGQSRCGWEKVAPAYLFSEEFHAQGPAAKYIAAEKQQAGIRDEGAGRRYNQFQSS